MDYNALGSMNDLYEDAANAVELVRSQLRRDLTDEEIGYAPTMVSDVCQQIRAMSWQFDREFQTSEVFRRLVCGAVGRAVARVLRMGDSMYQRESVGDYSYAFDAGAVTGSLKLLPEDKAALFGLSHGWAVSGQIRSRAECGCECIVCQRKIGG